MFRLGAAFPQFSPRFPRARGDVPQPLRVSKPFCRFSPRTRGCSVHQPIQVGYQPVFPAHAGMFPQGEAFIPLAPSFSPRTRGCSCGVNHSVMIATVFPAHAGMFPKAATQAGLDLSFPRARGDVPAPPRPHAAPRRFSPRTRGCSFLAGAHDTSFLVFPAHAGMFPLRVGWRPLGRRFPRARGDVPSMVGKSGAWGTFSPRTRGCSGKHFGGHHLGRVFPAHAGMFPAPPCR